VTCVSPVCMVFEQATLDSNLICFVLSYNLLFHRHVSSDEYSVVVCVGVF